jgi:hypothetical protein
VPQERLDETLDETLDLLRNEESETQDVAQDSEAQDPEEELQEAV